MLDANEKSSKEMWDAENFNKYSSKFTENFSHCAQGANNFKRKLREDPLIKV